MNSFKMLMLAALTIMSVAAFAQDIIMQEMKTPKQKTENVKYSCHMHDEVMIDKPVKCPKCAKTLVKQKMADEQIKLMQEGIYTKSEIF